MATRVLLVPGFMQRGEAWAPVAELLPQRYPSTLLDHQADDLEGRLAEIAAAARPSSADVASGRASRCVVVGYSLGGRLALQAVLRHPERYDALVVVGAAAGIEDPIARAARRRADERLAGWMDDQPIEEVVAVWERLPIFADQSEALVEVQRPGRLSHDPRALATLLRTAGQGAVEPLWRLLPRLDLPVLAIAGARDEGYAAAARRIAATVRHGTVRVVEGAGHAPQLERPGAVASLLVEFLDEHLV